jgi:hypothetical protein
MEKYFRKISNTKDATAPNPAYPILIGLSGNVYEAVSIRGAVAAIISSLTGEDYLDVESIETEWHLRVKAARRIVVLAYAEHEKDAIIWHEGYGRIKENYAAKENDPDYIDDFKSEPHKILVNNELTFLKTLMELEIIEVSGIN